jgi:hypothetical protein
MIGKWDKWYAGVTTRGSFRYGNTDTYKLGATFLKGLYTVEDWGCGLGGFREVYKGRCIGIDGSANPFVDRVVDLRTYRSLVEGIYMRHVLEHNYDWRMVLQSAMDSFEKKFCLVLFTPFSDTTHEIAHNLKHGVDVPDISFRKDDVEEYFKGYVWRMESIKSKTHYKIEHIYYIEK